MKDDTRYGAPLTLDKRSVQDIRNYIRNTEDPYFNVRRKIGLICAIGLVDFSVVSLYQMGYIRKLPDLPGKIFDSNQVNAAPKAYQWGVPDGPLGIFNYAINFIAASITPKLISKILKKETAPHLLSLAPLAVSASLGSLGAIDYLRDMITVQKKACPYCLVGAGFNFAILYLISRELKLVYQGKTYSSEAESLRAFGQNQAA